MVSFSKKWKIVELSPDTGQLRIAKTFPLERFYVHMITNHRFTKKTYETMGLSERAIAKLHGSSKKVRCTVYNVKNIENPIVEFRYESYENLACSTIGKNYLVIFDPKHSREPSNLLIDLSATPPERIKDAPFWINMHVVEKDIFYSLDGDHLKVFKVVD